MRLADNETQASGTKCAEACWSNYTLCKTNAMKFEAEVEQYQARSAVVKQALRSLKRKSNYPRSEVTRELKD
jgi:hypothetical protein